MTRVLLEAFPFRDMFIKLCQMVEIEVPCLNLTLPFEFDSNFSRVVSHAYCVNLQSSILPYNDDDGIKMFRRVASNQIYHLADPSGIVSMHISIPSRLSKLKTTVTVSVVCFDDSTIMIQSIPDHYYNSKKPLVVSPGMIKRALLPLFQSTLNRPILRHLRLDESEILFSAHACGQGPFIGRRVRMNDLSAFTSASDLISYETIGTHNECTIMVSDFFENDSNMILDIMRHYA